MKLTGIGVKTHQGLTPLVERIPPFRMVTTTGAVGYVQRAGDGWAGEGTGAGSNLLSPTVTFCREPCTRCSLADRRKERKRA